MSTTNDRWLELKEDLRSGGYIMTDLFALTAACYLTRNWPEEPLWIMCVASPGSGKTISINQFKELADTEIVSAVTPASLISGWGGKDIDNSLFARIDGHCLIAKDFGTILSMSSAEIGKVFSYLREAFDGEVHKNFGHLSRDYPDLHFNFLAVTTEACERVSSFRQQLGERFLRFNVPKVDLPSPPPKVDPSLKAYVAEWMRKTETPAPTELTQEQYDWIATVCKACSKLRTEVIHDSRSKEVLEIPHFEGSARLEKQMEKMFQGLMLVTGNEEETKRLCKEAGKSSIKPRKIKVLQYLFNHDQEECKAKEIADEIRHGYNVVRRLLNDMWTLELVDRDMIDFPKTYIWKVADEFEEDFKLLIED